MELESVRSALQDAGYPVAALTAINEGSNHDVFDVVLEGGAAAICKFTKVRETERGIVGENTDTLFGGHLSLDRECYLLGLARNKGGLPVPEVYGTHASPLGQFVLLEKSPGISFTAWQGKQGDHLGPYLESLRALGRDFAAPHSRVQFPAFGDVMEHSVIHPGVTNFADRFEAVTEMRIDRGAVKGTFTPAEAATLRQFFHERFEALRPALTVSAAPPVMVFTDMHGENFFVDETGTPSGYFDLESAQAAPAALEFYGFRFFLFNRYDAATFPKAEAAFFEGYRAAGGPCAPKTAEDEAVIELLSGCRLLELAQSYWGVVDAIRDTWGLRMKALLFRYLDTGLVDYSALGALWRERDGQPLCPNP